MNIRYSTGRPERFARASGIMIGVRWNRCERHKEYSSWEANRYLWLQSAEATASWEALNERQRFKYRYLDRFWLAYFYFLFHYFIKRGFLDGRAGLRFAYLKFLYFRDVRLKIAEARRNGKPDSRSRH